MNLLHPRVYLTSTRLIDECGSGWLAPRMDRSRGVTAKIIVVL